MSYSGAMTFVRGTRHKRVPLYQVTSLAALETFAQQIDTLSTSSLKRVSVTEVADFTVAAETATAYVGYYAVVRVMNDSPAEGENPYREVQIPDPAEDLFELNEQIPVVKATVGAQVATWYSTVTGKPYTFVKGWLWKG